VRNGRNRECFGVAPPPLGEPHRRKFRQRRRLARTVANHRLEEGVSRFESSSGDLVERVVEPPIALGSNRPDRLC
jgi:hypothetical protein